LRTRKLPEQICHKIRNLRGDATRDDESEVSDHDFAELASSRPWPWSCGLARWLGDTTTAPAGGWKSVANPMKSELAELDRISDYPTYWAARHPDREAMVLGDLRWTYADLARYVDLYARALWANGLRRGDRVAVLATARPESLALFLAAARIGAMFTGLNLRFKYEELHYVVDDSKPRLLFYLPEFAGRDYRADMRHLLADIPSVEQAIAFGAAEPGFARSFEVFLGGAASASAAEVAAAVAAVQRLDPCLLIYTSGSTGQPKGAMLPHYGLSHCSRNQLDHWWAEPLRVLDNLPISNVFCIGDLFCFCMVGGGTTVFMERFDAKGVLETIEREKVTLWGQVATMLQLVLAQPEAASRDLSSLQMIFWAGARAPRELIERLGRITSYLGSNYGLTETVAGVTYTEKGASLDVLADTVGKPDPHYELRVVAPDGRVCADGEAGEILVRGHCMMVGYWSRPEATAAAIDNEGWLHTGDIGFRRPDGNFQIAGRKSDMFKSGGFNVYPREIEMMLETHPAVAMAAVIGVPDDLYGEVGHAYLLLREADGPAEPDMAAWCKERLANFKVPKRFHLRRQLPMLPVGKIDKVALRKEAGLT
jgi:acyl-CoA synthetase (AMP-forming)/AMP-acid ligase II